MRVAQLCWTNRRVAGAEAHAERSAHGLLAQGHEVAWFHEGQQPNTRPVVDCPHQIEADLGALAAWQPDVLLNHGLLDPRVEAAALDLAPAVLVTHSYYGTCISGSKTYRWPRTSPCTRTLGWGCVLRYYPRHTGGWSPSALQREWRRQRARQSLLPRYRAVVGNSRHMLDEYARHGVPTERLFEVPFPMASAAVAEPPPRDVPHRLLWVGRCDPLKGGAVLLDALQALPATVHLTMVGDGPARTHWERRAAAIGPRVRFTGWVDDVTPFYRDADLVVIPSLWPEPFGQVGLEAARFGLPAVGFPVGGIPAWLKHEVNGMLAARPNDADALARAIRDALEPARYPTLARGALAALATHTIPAYVRALERVMEAVR
ncbi:MAG: glycosyltransferase family 4 protein [Gemmatimonadales bacterium]